MKKFILALVTLFTLTVSANAMSYEQARQQALFLTDKMAYELNLTDEQYEAAYEINLDYLMSINDYSDLYGVYWTQRNLDLSYILLDWQYRTYCAANYFYRPLYYNDGYWRFRVYARYPHRDYFYFGRPGFYAVYRGGHSWRINGGQSWYRGRDFGCRDSHRYIGMRDHFNQGNYGRGFSSRNFDNYGNENRVFGGNRNSRIYGNDMPGNSSFGGYDNYDSRSNRSFDNNTRTRIFGGSAASESRGNGAFNNRQSSTRSTVPAIPTRPFGADRGSSIQEPTHVFDRPSTGHTFGGSAPSRSFNDNAPTRSFGGSAPSPSFGGGNAPTRSFGGGSTTQGSHGVFGGRR